MPAEWERHEATWLSWPKDPNTFPPEILPSVEKTYTEMVQALTKGEEVRILVDDDDEEARVRSIIKHETRVSYHHLKTVDVWVRDYAPIYVKGDDLAITKWDFNAWGNKYQDLLPDNASGERIADSTRLKTFRPGIVLEGGSIDVNGEGTVITTEQCLLNANRNPKLRKATIEKVLSDNLAVDNFVWLGRGIDGDDTDGHVDDIARFAGPRKVLVAQESNESDINHRVLSSNKEVMEQSYDQGGSNLEVIEVPMPDPLSSSDGRLPASHLNFYIGNAAVLAPTFGGQSDKKALEVIQDAFPSREVVGIDCRGLVHGLGTIHCVTQQVPAI